jgi:hypothetical protein
LSNFFKLRHTLLVNIPGRHLNLNRISWTYEKQRVSVKNLLRYSKASTRTVKTSERVIVPTVEKGIQRMEAKKKGKRHAWQPWYEITSCLVCYWKSYQGTICCCCRWMVLCYEWTICLVCWKTPQTFGFIYLFWGWLVCWKYCCLCVLIDVDVVLRNDNFFSLLEILFRCVKKWQFIWFVGNLLKLLLMTRDCCRVLCGDTGL